MLQPEVAANRFRKVWEMIDGYVQAMAVLHHPALLVMPDGRTRLLWRKA